MGKYIVFGTKDAGQAAMRLLKAQYANEEYYYCDNYNSGILDGIEILSFEKLCYHYSEDVHIYIASKRLVEIYIQCYLQGIHIEGFWIDSINDFVYDYKEACKLNLNGYKNQAAILQERDDEIEIENACKQFLDGQPLSHCLQEIDIEISNLCGYACIHSKCPASLIMDKQIMSREKIYRIIDELSEMGFDGRISFQGYNEMTMDPRLFSIIEYIRKKLHGVKVIFYSNGYYINQTMVDELEEGVADILIITGYGKSEYERMIDLDVNIPYTVVWGNLDDRIDGYKESAECVSIEICRSLIAQLTVYVNGDIGLCCLDYRHDSGLGNIFTDGGIRKCLDSEIVTNFQTELLHGNRSRHVLCRNCTWER